MTVADMATIHGRAFIHTEAVKGYLECRKLLVERETQLVYMRIKGDLRLEAKPRPLVEPIPLTETEQELALVRAQIAEIDALIKGGE